MELSKAILASMEARKRTLITFAKIATGFYQIVSAMPFILPNVPWPSMFENVSSSMSFINLDFVTMPSLSCMSPGTFFSRLELYVVGPFAVVLALAVTGLVGHVCFKHHPKLPAFYDGLYYNLNTFFFLMYPVVSATAFSTFACADVDGKWLLKADYDVECYVGEHARKHMILGCIGVILYPIGIPLFTAFILVKHGVLEVSRQKIEKETEKQVIIYGVLKSIISWDMNWKIQDGLTFADLPDGEMLALWTQCCNKSNGGGGGGGGGSGGGGGGGGAGGGNLQRMFTKASTDVEVTREKMEADLVDWAQNEGAQEVSVGELSFMSYDNVDFELTEAGGLLRTSTRPTLNRRRTESSPLYEYTSSRYAV